MTIDLCGASEVPGSSISAGIVFVEVDGKKTLLSVSLTKRGLFYSSVIESSVSGSTITLNVGSMDIGRRISQANSPLYLEVLTDGRRQVSPGVFQVLPVVGHRFEIDSAATVASLSHEVVLTENAGTNTIWPPPDLSGAKIVVREHVTIGEIFGNVGNSLLHGTGMASTSDRISFYDNDSREFITYWFRKNASGSIAQWRSLDPTDETDYSDRVIPPGVGVLLYRQPSAGPVTLHHIGHLRETLFRLPLPAGYSLVSHSRPLDHSPGMARMFQSSGWEGSSSSANSDEIQVWNGESRARYWFRSEDGGSVQQWRSSILTDTRDRMYDAELIHGDRAIFIRKRTADLDYLMDLQPGGAPAPSP